MTLLDISYILSIINNNGTHITNILYTRYTKSEVDNSIRNVDLNVVYTQTEIQTTYFDKKSYHHQLLR